MDCSDMASYEKCLFFKQNVCGPSLTAKKSGIFLVSSLSTNISHTLGFKECDQVLTEAYLIQNRANIEISDVAEICAYHRYYYGLRYNVKKMCHHPMCKSKAKSEASLRKATYEQYRKMKRYYGFFILGGLLCKSCRLTTLKPDDDIETSVDDINIECEDRDIDFIDASESKERLNQLLIATGLSPVQFQSTQNSWSNCDLKTRAYAKRKLDNLLEQCTQIFAQGFIPNDPSGFLSSSSTSDDDENDLSLSQIKKMYQSAYTAEARFIVLTIAAKKFSRATVVKEIECTERQFNRARASGLCMLPEKAGKFRRERLDKNLTVDFINYLFDSGSLQTAAYGTNMFVYDGGQKVEVPKPIIVGSRRQICSAYIDACKEMTVNNLSLSSLMKILRTIRPSPKSNLSGVDNFIVDGEEAVNTLVNILSKVVTDRKAVSGLEKRIRKSETYIKTNFSIRCSVNSEPLSHCILCSLSDPADSKFYAACKNEHSARCIDCDNIIELLFEIEAWTLSYDGEDKESVKFEFDLSKVRIQEWLAHNMRGVRQNESQTAAYEELSHSTFLMMRDWAQKVLPMRHREGQIDYFAKKGLSLHVDIFFGRNRANELEKAVYLTCLDKCDQDLAETMVVFKVVLAQFVKDYPEAKRLMTRQDNAGCYAGNGSFECQKTIAEEMKLELKRIDFPESQRGKCANDREAAINKRKIKWFVSLGNNVLTAKDIKTALMYNGGLKNTKVCVLEISQAKFGNVSTISGISNIHSVAFENKTMKYWKYFEIGEGKEKQCSRTKLMADFTIQSPFDDFMKRGPIVPRTSTTRYNFPFYCQTYSCDASFGTLDELDSHILEGNHHLIPITSSSDLIKSTYRQLAATDFHKFNVNPISKEAVLPKTNEKSNSEAHFKIGWALPHRKTGRLNEKARTFCLEKFLEGEKTGKKYSPEQIVALMKEVRDEKNKQAMFSSAELLTVRQVKGLFSRLSTYFRQLNKPGTSNSPYKEMPDATTLLHLIPTIVQDQESELMYESVCKVEAEHKKKSKKKKKLSENDV